MAAVALEFALNVSKLELSESHVATKRFALPTLISGSTVNFRIRLVKSNPSGGYGALSVIPLDGLSLTVGIGTAGASLTSGTLVLEGDELVGSVPLNVAAITGLFPGAEVEKTIEFRVNDGGLYQPLQLPVRIRNSVLTPVTIDPAPPEEALSKTEAAQAYVPRDGGAPGQGFIMKNSTKSFRVYVGDDDQLHWERIV